MRALIALALFGLVAVSATATFGAISFCERYALTKDSAGESALITAVLGRALNGNGTTSTTPAVRGILNNIWEVKYFNGTGGATTNYYADAPARQGLVDKLVNFFEIALSCRAVTTNTPANMKTAHAAMSISKRVWDEFIGELGNTLTSFGVSSADITFAVNLLAQFKKGLGNEICNAADCDAATPIKEFFTGTIDGNNAWLAADSTTSVTIAPGGWVHFNMATAHNVRQTDSNYAALTGGFTSGAVGSGVTSYNWQVPATPTDTTYYFMCEAHPTTMRAKIVVGNGGLSGASSLTASVAVVLSAIAAAVALRF